MIHVLPRRFVRIGGHGLVKMPAFHALNNRHHAFVIEAEVVGCLDGGFRHGDVASSRRILERAQVVCRFSLFHGENLPQRYFLSRPCTQAPGRAFPAQTSRPHPMPPTLARGAVPGTSPGWSLQRCTPATRAGTSPTSAKPAFLPSSSWADLLPDDAITLYCTVALNDRATYWLRNSVIYGYAKFAGRGTQILRMGMKILYN